jgi:hypothetical protein
MAQSLQPAIASNNAHMCTHTSIEISSATHTKHAILIILYYTTYYYTLYVHPRPSTILPALDVHMHTQLKSTAA